MAFLRDGCQNIDSTIAFLLADNKGSTFLDNTTLFESDFFNCIAE